MDGMKQTVPDSYDDFVCIADRCRHSCCIGWEIDIDDETLEKYRNVKGDFGKRLRDGIELDECGAHFHLGEHERCPFLNQKGLCDIILTIGEENLSQICTDHPRFCSFYSDRTEIGLGLCCEEAARLLLSKESKTEFFIFDDGEDDFPTEREQAFFAFREKLFALAQNRTKTVSARMADLQRETGGAFPNKAFSEWADIFLSLECLDEAWRALLLEAKENPPSEVYEQEWENAWEQILVYFLYRHVSDPEREFAAPVLFAILGVYMIRHLYAHLCSRSEPCMETLTELCRLYSSEIEYSEENTEKLLSILESSV